MNLRIREKLIQNAVKNLREWYPDVNSENIFTDEVYSQLFLIVLKDESNWDHGVDSELTSLIEEIKNDEERIDQ